MSLLSSSASDPSDRVQQPDDVDNVLKRYFEREMPSVWPDAPAVANSAALDARPISLPRARQSRWVLAASILLLFVGQIWLSGLFSGLAVDRSDREPGRMEATKRNSRTPPSETHPSAKPRSTSGIFDGSSGRSWF
jgi:hypothetical protein